VSLAVANARLFETVRRAHADLALAYDATVRGWSTAMEMRDADTHGHAERVARLTERLASELGAPEAELEHVYRGALLHDIGKMTVPDAILLKPGPLDEAEWEVMRRHPEHARRMLQDIALLRPAVDIPYCHHERWDGTGYPRGLSGEDIPLAARIFSVIDVFEALTSDRPYRRAWTRDDALAYIRDSAGSQFDPRVVGAFLRAVGVDEDGHRS
jgi:putative nucleotidyltransferase with HDIG domain